MRYTEIELQRRVRIVVRTNLVLAAAGLLYVVQYLHAAPKLSAAIAGASGIALVAAWFARRGKVAAASPATTAALWVLLLLVGFNAGGNGVGGAAWIAAVPLVGGLLSGRKAIPVWTLASLASVAGLALAELTGQLPPGVLPASQKPLHDAVGVGTFCLFAGGISYVFLTSQERAQQQLLVENEEREGAAEEARRANAAKSQFLAIVSHELRTPMNGIIGMAQLLKKTSLTQEQEDYASTITSSAGSLLLLVNDILDFARIESGRIELDLSDYELDTVIESVRTLFFPAAKHQGIDLVVVKREPFQHRLRGDHAKLRQVLVNLVGNAIKFTKQGKVSVEIETADELTIRVRDTGAGIAPDMLDKVFLPFVQADTSRTRSHGGTGLGLSIVKKLAEAMGGRVSVESEVGRGSCFSVVLPILQPSKASAFDPGPNPLHPEDHMDDGSDATGSRGLLLIVEDNAVNEKVITAMVRKLGYAFEIANDGAEAVSRANPSKHAAVLMDCHMPVMDGFEASAKLRKRFGREIPIIGVSADVQATAMQRGEEAGMDAFVSKPIAHDALRDTLRRVVQSRTSSERKTSNHD